MDGGAGGGRCKAVGGERGLRNLGHGQVSGGTNVGISPMHGKQSVGFFEAFRVGFLCVKDGLDMRIFRYLLSLCFGILAMVFLRGTFGDAPGTVHSQVVSQQRPMSLTETAVLIGLAVVFGVAWWTILREKASAGGWAIAASVLNLLICIGVPLLYCRTGNLSAFWQLERVFGIPTAIGIAGLVVYLRPNRHAGKRSLGIDETG